MPRLVSLVALGWIILSGFGFSFLAAEKVKFATAVKIYPPYYLPILAAEEKGYWKETAIEAEWVPFRGAWDMFRAVAARAVEIGMTPTITEMQAAARGAPLILISNLVPGLGGWAIWIPKGSPIKEVKDLKGAKLGVSGLGATGHAFGLAAVKVLGLEGKVRFVAVGGVATTAAALKAGVVNGVVTGPAAMLVLKAQGEARELLFLSEYLPKDWMDHALFATKEYLKEKPVLAKNMVRAVLAGVQYARERESWSLEKIKEVSGYSGQVARLWFDIVKGMTKDGRMEKKVLENLREFLINYKIVEKMPPAEELFTNELVP